MSGGKVPLVHWVWDHSRISLGHTDCRVGRAMDASS